MSNCSTSSGKCTIQHRSTDRVQTSGHSIAPRFSTTRPSRKPPREGPNRRTKRAVGSANPLLPKLRLQVRSGAPRSTTSATSKSAARSPATSEREFPPQIQPLPGGISQKLLHGNTEFQYDGDVHRGRRAVKHSGGVLPLSDGFGGRALKKKRARQDLHGLNIAGFIDQRVHLYVAGHALGSRERRISRGGGFDQLWWSDVASERRRLGRVPTTHLRTRSRRAPSRRHGAGRHRSAVLSSALHVAIRTWGGRAGRPRALHTGSCLGGGWYVTRRRLRVVRRVCRGLHD